MTSIPPRYGTVLPPLFEVCTLNRRRFVLGAFSGPGAARAIERDTGEKVDWVARLVEEDPRRQPGSIAVVVTVRQLVSPDGLRILGYVADFHLNLAALRVLGASHAVSTTVPVEIAKGPRGVLAFQAVPAGFAALMPSQERPGAVLSVPWHRQDEGWLPFPKSGHLTVAMEVVEIERRVLRVRAVNVTTEATASR